MHRLLNSRISKPWFLVTRRTGCTKTSISTVKTGSSAPSGPRLRRRTRCWTRPTCSAIRGLLTRTIISTRSSPAICPEVQNMELFDWLTTLYEIWKGLRRGDGPAVLSDWDGRAAEKRLHQRALTTTTSSPADAGDLLGPQVAGCGAAGGADACLPGQHGSFEEGRRPAAGLRRAGPSMRSCARA